MVQQVSDSDGLDKVLTDSGTKLVVIDFYATWCGPCKVIAPKLEEMSKQRDDVVFLKVDVDEAEDVAMEYNVSAMPTFVLIKNKKQVTELMGANFDKLKALVEQHANSTASTLEEFSTSEDF